MKERKIPVMGFGMIFPFLLIYIDHIVYNEHELHQKLEGKSF